MDPVYTGKAMLGMFKALHMDRMQEEMQHSAMRLNQEQANLLFVHTGGLFGVYEQGCVSALSKMLPANVSPLLP